ncbi:SPARK domain-containing protein [Psidium guajava]|nr:SPARK domain-containing protein [Psidium guajava]
MPRPTIAFASWLLLCTFRRSLAGLLAETVPGSGQPDNVPAFPSQGDTQICKLDLSAELFGGVGHACGRNLDRSRCCPVLAAWLFAAHARSALQITGSAPEEGDDSPMMPNDSQKCVDSLQAALESKNVRLPQPNASCDAVLCFCGIRLHQISSLSCPAAFNVSAGLHNATPTAAVRNLEKNCRNSSYAGCTKCLGSLQKLKGGYKNGTDQDSSERARKMFDRDCQLMGLTWLLARNKTAYIPTVSAVLRALMYSARPPHQSTCSPDQENMPLAVDSLQLGKAQSSSPPSLPSFPLLPLFVLAAFFV